MGRCVLYCTYSTWASSTRGGAHIWACGSVRTRVSRPFPVRACARAFVWVRVWCSRFVFFCGRLPLVLARAHSPRASGGAGTGLVGDAPTGPSPGRAHPLYLCFVVLFLYGRSAADTRGENVLFCSLCGRCWWWRFWLWGWRQFSWCAPPLWVTPARARRAHPLTASLRCR